MPTYNIYMLDESQMTISGGKGLDGKTQGTGIHLKGETITLNSKAWHPVSINDKNTAFDDNDGNQTLNGAQTVDGVKYPSGTKVEAEYILTVTDGTHTWKMIGFNVHNSQPAYATVEGLSVIGGPGGFPPAGVPLKVIGAGEGPKGMEASRYATPICFAGGTRIAVPGGDAAVEDLAPGREVCTLHHGVQRILWCAGSLHRAAGDQAPVRFASGVVGNAAPLVVSPQHSLYRQSRRADLLLGADEVLIPAVHFLDTPGVTRIVGGWVRYHHILFDRHEVVFSQGVASESFYPGPMALGALDAAAMAGLVQVVGADLTPLIANYGAAAGLSLRRHEAAALLAA